MGRKNNSQLIDLQKVANYAAFFNVNKMDIRGALLAEHSKTQTNKIVTWIGSNQQRFNELFRLFLNDEYRVVQRAAWPLSFAVIAHPQLIKMHFSKLIKNLEKPALHDAVKRNTLRLLQEIEIPKKQHGILLNHCFNYISSHTEKAAIKAFSLSILQNLAIQYPDIKQELITIIQNRWPYETPAFKSRARKIVKAFSPKKEV